MGRFASGNKAFGISDRSGFRYRLKDMKKEWNGLLVGPDEFEPNHPQLFPKRRIVDPQALRDARPDRKEPMNVYVGVVNVHDLTPRPLHGIGLVGEVTVTT